MFSVREPKQGLSTVLLVKLEVALALREVMAVYSVLWLLVFKEACVLWEIILLKVL